MLVPVPVSDIRKVFVQEPVKQFAEVGVTTELVCRPPAGVPTPTVCIYTASGHWHGWALAILQVSMAVDTNR